MRLKEFQGVEKIYIDSTIFVHIDYVDALRAKNVLQIITQTADPLAVKDLARKYQLLPRDASHLGIMLNNLISNIATGDSDFERVECIEVWKP